MTNLPNLSSVADALLAWLLTYTVHSTLLLAAAAGLAARCGERHALRELLWKAALLGPALTVTVQVAAGVTPLGGWRVPSTFASSTLEVPTLEVPALPTDAPSRATAPSPVEPPPDAPPAVEVVSGGTVDREPSMAVESSPRSGVTSAELSGREPRPSVVRIPWSVTLVATWLALAIVGLARLAAGELRLRQLLGNRWPLLDPSLLRMLDELRERAGERRAVRLSVSAACPVPLALRGGEIVVPPRFASELAPEQQRAGLAHELAHVWRHDPEWQLAALALERLFPFQPLHRLARRSLRVAAEYLSDEWSARQTGSPLALARCIETVAGWLPAAGKPSQPVPKTVSAMARPSSPVLRRVERLLAGDPEAGRSVRWLALPGLALALLAMVAAAPVVSAAAEREKAAGKGHSAFSEREDENGSTGLPRWTEADLSRARAALDLSRPPAPEAPLASRWQWALDSAAQRRSRDFWIVYGFSNFASAITASGAFAQAAPAWRSEGPFLGNVTDVAVDPSHPDTVYAATHGGGVWRSEDGGASWTLPGDEMTARSVNWVMVDPGKPTTLWVGVEDAGMWRSLDRGATWKQVEPNGEEIVGQRIAFAPSQPQSLFVPSTNLHYRSTDGGKTWASFRVAGQDAYCFAVHPTNPKVVLAGGRGQMLNVARSTDGGKTWKQTGKGIRDISLRRLLYNPSDPNIVYAYAGFHDVFKSTDGGDSFTPIELGVGGTDEVTDLELDAANPQVLWAATEGGLKTSRDGGASWKLSERGTGNYLISAVALVPGRPGAMLAASAGSGLYRSSDGGASWSPASQGLAAGWVKRVWPSPRQQGALFVQTSVGLYARGTGGGWNELREPFEEQKAADLDGILYDRTSPQTVYAFDGGKYWRSTDGGKSWREPERKEPGLRQMLRGDLSSAEFKSLAQDAGDAKTFYAGAWSSSEPGKAVFKSIDAGKNWKPAANGLPAAAVELLRSAAPKTVYAVMSKEGVYRTRDGGASWTHASSGLPGGEIHELAVDPGNPSRLFAATEHGLFGSTDGGDGWRRVTEGLKDDDIEGVAIVSDKEIWAGAFHGVFRSTDGGTTWTPMNGTMPNVDVRALAIAPGPPGRIYVGLAGGSVWSAELPDN